MRGRRDATAEPRMGFNPMCWATQDHTHCRCYSTPFGVVLLFALCPPIASAAIQIESLQDSLQHSVRLFKLNPLQDSRYSSLSHENTLEGCRRFTNPACRPFERTGCAVNSFMAGNGPRDLFTIMVSNRGCTHTAAGDSDAS